MIKHEFYLDMIPGGHRTEVFLNQYDEDFIFEINLFARDGEFAIQEGTTVAIRGTKPDGNGFSANAVLNGTKVTVTGDKQITAAAGKAAFELTLYKNDKELNTANFTVVIERAALDKDTVISRSQTRELVEIEDNADELIAAANQAIAAHSEIVQIAEGIATNAAAAVSAKAAAEKAQAVVEAALSDAEATAAEINALDTEANTLARQAMEHAANADNEAAELSNTVNNLKNMLTQLQLESGYHATELEVDRAGLVYLLNNGERIAGPYGPFAGNGGGGGGGSSTNNVDFSISNNTGWLSKTVTESDSCPVSVIWSSTMDEMPTGFGAVKVTVNGAVKATMNVQQGEVPIELSSYLSSGTNVVRVNISDSYGNNGTINFTISKVSISISSTFDATVPYRGAISFPYTPVGDVSKNVHIILDGREIGTTTTAVSNRQMTYTIPQQEHGPHTLECYFDCEINGQSVSSNHLYYEITCLDNNDRSTVITSSFNKDSVPQYTTLNVEYTVYNPVNATSNVAITVNGIPAQSVTVDRTPHTFSYRCVNIGPMTIAITAGGARKEITFEVVQSDVTVSAETDQLKLFLSSSGRSNSEPHPGRWEYEGVSSVFNNFNYTSDGWQSDDDGVPVLRINGDARLTIPYRPFASDFGVTGKTIEFEFATRDIADYDAVIISCMSGNRGFSVTPQKATLKSEQSEIFTQYKEDEHIRIAFVVEKIAENRLIITYINGIASGAVQYPANDDFSQVTPVDISLGSSNCTLDLYCIRIYDNDLTRHQILDNWIADTQNVTKMVERWRHNQVFNAYGSVVIENLPADLPYMIISCGELPQFKGDKKKVSVSYNDPLVPGNNFTAEGVQANVQGTSSAPYARKNYDMQFKNGFDTASGHTDDYKLRSNSIPFNRFVLKADVASSESVNNTGLTCLYNDTTPYKTPEQIADERVRQGIDGFPIVVFWHDTTANETSFLGKYNFNLPKRAAAPYGYSGDMESWEWQNNTSNLLLFHTDIFDETPWYDAEADEWKPEWRRDFEARFPDDTWLDYTKIRELVSFVYSTKREEATNESLPNDVTYRFDSLATVIDYGSDESFSYERTEVIGDDGKVEKVYYDITFTKDTPAYRLSKFKAEIGERMEIDSALFYYIFTELFLMVDSRAKNMFIGFKGSPVTLAESAIDRKAVLEPYDMDTALGTNNEGALVFGYSLEDTDHLAGDVDIFNGQNSVLWCNIRDAFSSEIMQMYKELRSAGKLSYYAVETMYEERQAKWPEAIWNEDAWFKYISPLTNPDLGKTATAMYLPMMQGSKAEQRKWWLYNRFRYMDSKWNAGDALSDVIQLRGYAKANITLTPYADVYTSIKWASYLTQKRGQHGTPTTIACPLDNVNDTEIYIYSASQLASIGDISGLKVGICDISKATKLQSLKVGDSSVGYQNTRLEELTLGNNVLLRTLDLRNCVAFTQPVDVSHCTSIEEIYLDGTKSTGITLPNGGILTALHLPNTISSLVIRNQKKLADLVIADYSALTTLWLENPSNAAETAFFTAISAMNSGARLRVTGLTLEMDDASEVAAFYDKLDQFRGLDEYGNTTTTAQVSGIIHLLSATGEELAPLVDRYPLIRISVDSLSATLNYYNYDGTELLYSETVEDYGNGMYEASPSRSSTAQYNYVFDGWSRQIDADRGQADAQTYVDSDRNLYAAYRRSIRQYDVTFKNGNTTLQVVSVPYGSSTDELYTGATPTKANVESDTGTTDYVFAGWTSHNTNWAVEKTVSRNLILYARFNDMSLTEETISDSWEEIVAAINDGTYRSKYNVGDTKKLNCGIHGIVSMQIAEFGSSYPIGDGSGKHAAITWVARNVLKRFLQDGKDDLNWNESAARCYLNETVFNALPEILRSSIATVIVNTEHSATVYEDIIEYTYDKLFIPDAQELNYSFMSNAENRIRTDADSGSAVGYNMRRMEKANNTVLRLVIRPDGSRSAIGAMYQYGSLMCFCLGVDNEE